MLTYRAGTIDYGVFQSVHGANEYKLPPRMDGQLVLDIGMHIGSFAFTCFQRGAAEVWGCEPDPENFLLARQNLEGCKIAVLLQVAVWRSDREEEVVHSGHLWNTGGGWTFPATAPTTQEWNARNSVCPISFDFLAILMTWGGRRRINMLKMDCETAEYPILLTAKRLDLVDQICGEYHVGRKDLDLKCTPHVLDVRLKEEGFVCRFNPEEGNTGKFWAWRESLGLRGPS